VPRTAGIVLAGGRSSRMGRPKAALGWHGSTLLRRVTGLVARAVDGPLVVVHAPGQELPALPPEVELAADAREGRGPLEGIAAGLAAVGGRAELAYVSATDVPFLHPAFVASVLRAADGVDVALPFSEGFRQTLSAAYRTELGPTVEELVRQDRLDPGDLFARARVRELHEPALLADPELAAADPGLLSLAGLNDPEAYERALARPEPEVTVEREGAEPQRLRASTLAAAAKRATIAPEGIPPATVNRRQIGNDPEYPLVEGDVVGFLA
jgi:molybdenum cofactor guanylyltransferase